MPTNNKKYCIINNYRTKGKKFGLLCSLIQIDPIQFERFGCAIDVYGTECFKDNFQVISFPTEVLPGAVDVVAGLGISLCHRSHLQAGQDHDPESLQV